MSGLSANQLIRSLGAMAHDINADRESNKQRKETFSLREIECQIQIPLGGISQAIPASSQQDIKFPVQFVIADGQRDTPNQDPHYWTGYTVESGPAVIVQAHVVQWLTDGDDQYFGARVRFTAHDPASTGESFYGVVHMTFQGLGAPNDDEQGDTDHHGTTGG